MKVIHIESGLGNQMLSYCEYLALKKIHPEEDMYLETLVYDFPEANETICQWNGYELSRVFGLDVPNIKEHFTEDQWGRIQQSIRNSRFWEKSWNWPVYFTEAFADEGLHLNNLRGDFERSNKLYQGTFKFKLRQMELYKAFQKTWLHINLRRLITTLKYDAHSDREFLYYTGTEDAFTGQKLSFQKRYNNIELIQEDIFAAFQFPAVQDRNNMEFLTKIANKNTVAIHVRRGDALNLCSRYYTGGYFKRAVKYIKRHVENPVFCFFCDPGSIEWVKENEAIFAINFKKDCVYFVDWNKGENSYRDIQLMSQCKHNIVTISSFGWWGAFLNQNPDKITISPEIDINTTHHF